MEQYKTLSVESSHLFSTMSKYNYCFYDDYDNCITLQKIQSKKERRRRAKSAQKFLSVVTMFFTKMFYTACFTYSTTFLRPL